MARFMADSCARDAGFIRPGRSLVCQTIGKLETAASAKPVGLDPNLTEALTNLKANSLVNGLVDWVFASSRSARKQPCWPDWVPSRQLQPKARRLGIKKAIGWRTFRRSCASLLLSSGADVKVCQESLRHANVRIRLRLYAQSFAEEKRLAQSKFVQMILPQTARQYAQGGVKWDKLHQFEKGIRLFGPEWTHQNRKAAFRLPVTA
jgi:hypothetical protein